MVETMQKNIKETDDQLNNLNKQILNMYEDFEDMKRARDDARKQLEARFLDIHKKMQYMQEALNSEGNRVNDSIKAFSSKFDFLLEELEINFYRSLKEEQAFTKDRFDEFITRM
jgi:chromosome segregation ATPase